MSSVEAEELAESLADAPPILVEIQDAAFARVNVEKPGGNDPLPPAGLLALFEQSSDKDAAKKAFDEAIAAAMCNEDGTPAWEETGPQLSSGGMPDASGQPAYSQCERSTKVPPLTRPIVTVQVGALGPVTGYLDHAMIGADPDSRQMSGLAVAALDLLAQGIIPEASHLCANDWCISRKHVRMETRMTKMDRKICVCRGHIH